MKRLEHRIFFGLRSSFVFASTLSLLSACPQDDGDMPTASYDRATIRSSSSSGSSSSSSKSSLGSESQSSSASLRTMLTCRVQIEGEAYFSNRPNGVTWQQSADVVITPDADFAVITDASPLIGQAGALWFYTNTALCRYTNCSAKGGTSLASVTTSRRSSGLRLTARMKESVVGFGTLNIYNLTDSVAAQVHNVLGGEAIMEISGDMRKLTGTLSLDGSSGFGGPNSTSGYEATLSGTCAQR